MSELEIPERALTVACDVYDAELIKSTGECAEKKAVRAAAPIIVAVELRVLAEMVEERASDASYRQPEEVTTALLREARHLRARAIALDPDGAP